jgi:hypothetical protein
MEVQEADRLVLIRPVQAPLVKVVLAVRVQYGPVGLGVAVEENQPSAEPLFLTTTTVTVA